MSAGRPTIDPRKPFYFRAQTTERGQPDRIDFEDEPIVASEDSDELVLDCQVLAEQYGGRHYVFMAIPVLRVTKRKIREYKLLEGK